MGCNCKWTEIVLGLVILIFAFIQAAYSQWVVAIAAVLLLIHALTCKNCGTCIPETKPIVKKKKK